MIRSTVFAIVCLVGATSYSAPVTILNPSFEDFPLLEGEFTTLGGGLGGFGWISQQPGRLNGIQRLNVPGHYDEIPDGVNVAYTHGSYIRQHLTAVLEENTLYTLQVDVGDPRGTSYSGYSIELSAGGVALASSIDQVIPTDGTFQTATLNYLALPGDGSIGNELVITLGASTLGGQEADFDNVRLTATSVPEPTTTIVLGLLGAGILIRRRKRPRLSRPKTSVASTGLLDKRFMQSCDKPLLHVFIFLTCFLSVERSTFGAVSTGLYLSDTSGDLYQLSSSTGASTLVGGMGVVMNDIAASPDGRLFGVSSTALYEINPETASVTEVGDLGINFASGLEFSSNGTLYLSDAPTVLNGSLYTVDTSTGLLNTIGQIGYASNGDLAFDDTGRLFMSGTNFTTDFNLIEINPLNGVGTIVGAHGFGSLPALDFDGNSLIGVTSLGDVISIDRTTGAGTLLTETVPTRFAAGLTHAVAVPEPGPFALLTGGAIVLLKRRRKPRSMETVVSDKQGHS